jgi:hypothetical protein
MAKNSPILNRQPSSRYCAGRADCKHNGEKVSSRFSALRQMRAEMEKLISSLTPSF